MGRILPPVTAKISKPRHADIAKPPGHPSRLTYTRRPCGLRKLKAFCFHHCLLENYEHGFVVDIRRNHGFQHQEKEGEAEGLPGTS